MSEQWAEANLATIRSLMERAAIYRRALGPVMTAAGGIGTLAAVGACFLEIPTARGFAIYWMATACLALAAAYFLVRRQAFKSSEPFWSPPTRRVTSAFLPGFFSGAMLGGLLCMANPEDGVVAVCCFWMVLYGCAVHSAGFFMPRGMKLFGWVAVLGGFGLLIFYSGGVDMPELEMGHYVMGGFFGVGHLLYGVYLFVTEAKRG